MLTRFAMFGAALLVHSAAMADDKSTIQAENERFAADFVAGNFAAVAAHYAEDAVLLPPGAPLMRGRAAIQAYWTAAAAQVGSVKLSAQDVAALGPNVLREIGTFAVQTKTTPPQSVEGKYVVIWTKADGGWKLQTDIWNMDK
jgi:uncharacterized protein (TIGR02246 family)